METRAGDDDTYRRRKCDGCRKAFVSVETTTSGLAFPSELNRHYRAKQSSRLVRRDVPLGTIESGFAGWARP